MPASSRLRPHPTDGIPLGTVVLNNINPGTASYPQWFTLFNDSPYVAAAS